jgi:cell division protein FtsB
MCCQGAEGDCACRRSNIEEDIVALEKEAQQTDADLVQLHTDIVTIRKHSEKLAERARRIKERLKRTN